MAFLKSCECLDHHAQLQLSEFMGPRVQSELSKLYGAGHSSWESADQQYLSSGTDP